MTSLLPALKTLAPGTLETRVFQAALSAPERAFDVLQTWENGADPDLVRYLAGHGKWMRGQQPLIYANLQNQLAHTPLVCRPYLKTATVRERKRYDVFLNCLTDAMDVLNAVGLPYCVVKGVAVANTVYPDPILRHCHDLDVVVHPSDQPRVAKALADADFTPVTHPCPGLGSLRFDHPTGLPVVLHAHPVAGLSWIDSDWMMQDARQIETPAGQMTVPAPSRRILHAWLHRFVTDRFERHIWVPDTVLDLRRCSDRDIQDLNSLLAEQPACPEAFGAATYLALTFDDIPQISRLHWPPNTRSGRATAQQRVRLARYARASGEAHAFTKSLPLVSRLQFTYDRILPPASFFETGNSPQKTTLWRLRFRRLAKGVLRRLRRV